MAEKFQANKDLESKKLENLMNLLADSLESASAEEMLDEDAELSASAVVKAEGVRRLLLDEVGNYRKKLASDAMRHHAASIAEFLKRPYRLPTVPAEQRQLLNKIFTEYPHIQSSLTLQHRDFRTLSDSDVESLLKQLEALGVFEDL